MSDFKTKVMAYQRCPDCLSTMHPDYIHLDYRDCQIALAAALGAINLFAKELTDIADRKTKAATA